MKMFSTRHLSLDAILSQSKYIPVNGLKLLFEIFFPQLIKSFFYVALCSEMFYNYLSFHPRPLMHLPVPSKATIVVRFCPLLYELRKVPRVNSGGRSHLIKLIDLEYHICDVQSFRFRLGSFFYFLFFFLRRQRK